MANLSFLERSPDSSEIEDLGLYIHVPFCKQRCHFCAFYLTLHRESLVDGFLHALETEIDLFGEKLGHLPISTIYVGGGTPTSLAPVQLLRVLERVAKAFPVHSSAEITLEASPDSVTKLDLEVLRGAGVNRLSFGAQSFEESEWEPLGRSGKIPDIRSAVQWASEVGFQNISVDLIYGLPKQTPESWQHSLMQAVELNPTHVSCYALTIEKGTRFYRDHLRDELFEGSADLQHAMEALAVSYLSTRGYQRYEISSFGRPGYNCRHNLRYWSGQSYLGLGPSAQSYVGGVRFGNVEGLQEYCRQLKGNQCPLVGIEKLTKNQSARERVVFGLRLIEGFDLRNVQNLTHEVTWRSSVNGLINDGLLTEEGSFLRLTEVGRCFADSVAIELM